MNNKKELLKVFQQGDCVVRVDDNGGENMA